MHGRKSVVGFNMVRAKFGELRAKLMSFDYIYSKHSLHTTVEMTNYGPDHIQDGCLSTISVSIIASVLSQKVRVYTCTV